MLQDAGDLTAALSDYRRSLKLRRQLGDRLGMINALEGLAY